MISKLLRVAIMFVLVFGVTMLAKSEVASAGSVVGEAAQSGTAQVEGYVWNDANRDGLQEAGEVGIENVTVNLYDSSNVLADTTLTDPNGLYQFNSLTPGDYYVSFVRPAGYLISPQGKGRDDAVDSDAHVLTGKTALKTFVAGGNTLNWDVGFYKLINFLGNVKPGTVKPPPPFVKACENGVFSVGGAVTLEIKDLKPDYCIEALLWNHAFSVGRIPKDAGKVLAYIGFVRIYHHSRLVHELPAEDGTIKACFAIPLGKQAQIYFLDFYGPRFGNRTGQPSWEKVDTTVENGIACAFVQKSGAYALIGK
ncbi:MAG: SdrD B-like domain-containing protein [Chloroflexota bacterium]